MSPEKKKTVVIGSLVVAMLGIGVVQFGKMGEQPAPAASSDAKPKAKHGESEDEKPATKNPMYAAALPVRDPFRPASFSAPTPTPAAAPTPAPAPAIGRGPSLGPAIPSGLGGQLAPMPMPGGPPSGLPPVVPVEKPHFRARLIGVLVGARSAAVFRVGDADRIVSVGGEIEPGVRLLSVRARRATVRFHDETLVIDLQDEAPADAPEAPKSAKSSRSSLSNAPKTAPTPESGEPDSDSQTSHD